VGYRVRVQRVPIVFASLLAASLLAAAAGAARKPVQATFVGDSVSASISHTPTAQAQLTRGLSVRLDLEVCRRLVQPSCAYRGSSPTTALQAVQSYGRALGEVLIVMVGHNDSAYGYAQGIDRVMRAVRSQGVDGVVWVTLRETSSVYHRTNVAIESAAKRWPQLVIADWDTYSRDEPWFGRDGLHLTDTGASALASFLRANVLEVARSTS